MPLLRQVKEMMSEHYLSPFFNLPPSSCTFGSKSSWTGLRGRCRSWPTRRLEVGRRGSPRRGWMPGRPGPPRIVPVNRPFLQRSRRSNADGGRGERTTVLGIFPSDRGLSPVDIGSYLYGNKTAGTWRTVIKNALSLKTNLALSYFTLWRKESDAEGDVECNIQREAVGASVWLWDVGRACSLTADIRLCSLVHSGMIGKISCTCQMDWTGIGWGR